MFSSHPYHSQNSNPNHDEQRWIINICRALDKDDGDLDQEHANIPVTIFNVPKALKLISPECYLPQQVALGPYRQLWSPESLHEMERYKLFAAKRYQKTRQGLRFCDLVEELSKFKLSVCASYHGSLDFNGDTLFWVMALDSCFLLEFLQIFAQESSSSSYFAKHKSNRNVILRDIVMLENQIPLFLLRKTLEFQVGSSNQADKALYNMMMGFSKEILPFDTLKESFDVGRVMGFTHLLDFLYHLIVPKYEGSSSETEITSDSEKNKTEEPEKNNIRKFIYWLRLGQFSSTMKTILVSKPVEFISKLPRVIISTLPGVILIRQIEYLCFSQEKAQHEPEKTDTLVDSNKHQLIEEITIPSVTELVNAGVKFSVTNLGLSGINFDAKTTTLHLPRIRIDSNTEVVIKNLVAYESGRSSGPLFFVRYTELMNGIIDTDEDAKLLRERGVVLNHLKSDQEVASLWNGMSKSIRLTKVPFLDRVVEDVNEYYSGKWRVKIGRFLARNVYGSWRSLAFCAAVLMLFLMSLQAFCTAFGCDRVFLHHSSTHA